jgi:peptidylprolyl isomerase
VPRAKPGDRVKVHYTGRLEDGTVFDTSVNRPPLELIVGGGDVIPGFDRALVGLEPGAFVIENIPARLAFGEYKRALVMTVSRASITPHGALEVGKRLTIELGPGQSIQAKVVAVQGQTVTLDTNHPLAGKDLTLEIQILDVL